MYGWSDNKRVNFLMCHAYIWCQKGNYKGESNENLKSTKKFETQLDCLDNSDTHGLKSGRHVVVRCRNATWWRSSGVKMAAQLATCTNEEQPSVIHFLSSEGVKPIEIHRRMEVPYGDACLSLQKVYEWTWKFTNGTSSVTDSPRPGQALNHLRERLCWLSSGMNEG
jgi:hypothetical protein